MTRLAPPGPQHPFDQADHTGALDLARYQALHAEPEPVDEEPRYLWVVDLVGGAGIALILVYVAYQVAAKWVS